MRISLRLRILIALVSAVPAGLIWNGLATPRVALKWSTSSELDLAGFVVSRAASLQGPYRALHSGIIAAADDPQLGGQYRYEDQTVSDGETYYYQIEEINLSGRREFHGPIEATGRRSRPLQELLPVIVLTPVLVLAALKWVNHRKWANHRGHRVH